MSTDPDRGTADGRSRNPALRLVAFSTVLVVLALIPVAACAWLFNVHVAQGLYVGIVLMTTVVLGLEGRDQWYAAVFCAVVAALGAALGAQSWWLIPALLVVCAGQGWFTLRGASALSVLPAVLMLNAQGDNQAYWLPIGVATLCGAAYLILLAKALKVSAEPVPLQRNYAVVHTVMLAAGCVLMLLLARWMDLERAHWGLLAYCLMLTPAVLRDGLGTACRYVAMVFGGAALAALLGATGLAPLLWTALGVGAVATVAGTLGKHRVLAVGALTTTVVVLHALTSGEAVGWVGLQRAGLAGASLLACLLIVGIGRLIDHRLSPRHFRDGPSPQTGEPA